MHKRVASIGIMTLGKFIYRLYLKSLGWKLTKRLRKGKYCTKCGTTQYLELHHVEYTWHNKHKIARWVIPNMQDRMKTLCGRCHRLEHK